MQISQMGNSVDNKSQTDTGRGNIPSKIFGGFSFKEEEENLDNLQHKESTFS